MDAYGVYRREPRDDLVEREVFELEEDLLLFPSSRPLLDSPLAETCWSLRDLRV